MNKSKSHIFPGCLVELTFGAILSILTQNWVQWHYSLVSVQSSVTNLVFSRCLKTAYSTTYQNYKANKPLKYTLKHNNILPTIKSSWWQVFIKWPIETALAWQIFGRKAKREVGRPQEADSAIIAEGPILRRPISGCPSAEFLWLAQQLEEQPPWKNVAHRWEGPVGSDPPSTLVPKCLGLCRLKPIPGIVDEK